MPYNFICAQAGAVLGELSSTSDILSVPLLLKLLLVSFISLFPVVYGKRMKRWARRRLGTSANNNDDDLEKGSEIGLSSL